MASSADELRALLAEHGIETVLIGAHAANRYRLEVRHTVDVDYLASTLKGAAAVLRDAGCVVREVDEDGSTYLISARVGTTRIDLLLAETEYQRAAMARASGGVLAVEDVIVHKLIAGRPKDLDDIRSILSTEISFDRGYVERCAEQWDVLSSWTSLAADK